MKATVIVPNYNGIAYIRGCLDSLYALAEQELFQVLVVDNGSTDGSLQALREEYPQTAVYALPENTGFCHAVNVGIEASKTPYVILLNNDTVVLPGFVKELVEAMEKRPKAFGASSCMLQWQDHGRIDDAGDRYNALGWAYARGKGRPASDYQKEVRLFAVCGGACIYRKSILEQIGLFDENHFAYLEDIDLSYRAAIHGYPCYYAPASRVLHAGSASSGSRYNEFKTKLTSTNSVWLVLKNMPLLQLLWNLPFLLSGFFIKTLFFVRKGMGGLYLQGLWRGFKRGFTAEGRTHKVPFRWRNLPNYLYIQLQLYLNLFRMLVKK